ncbi:hypothetical protein S1R3Y_000041 [Vibrio phage vB_ValP_VA-RY-3]|nr:hypothetical protein S1R3Y_000041 [Vibrio phage vB_ValP_VA-RY-3]
MIIRIPTPEQIISCWDEVLPFIQKAVDESNGELSADEVKRRVELKEVIIATIFDNGGLIAAISFELITFPSGKKVLNIQGAGGSDMADWFEDIDKLANELAKKHDCTDVYIIGRKGWERQLKDLNYKHVHTVIGREVY